MRLPTSKTMHVSSAAEADRFGASGRLHWAAALGQSREVMLFLAIGGIGALIYVTLNVALTMLGGLRPSLAILMTLAVLIPPTYLAQRSFAFRSDRPHTAAFPRYIGTQLVGNGLGLLGAELFPGMIRSQPLMAFLVLAAVVAVTNYGCLKFWAFRRDR